MEFEVFRGTFVPKITSKRASVLVIANYRTGTG
jgi:hypothetical protein